MTLLLDTHVLLWALSSPERLSSATRARIEDPATLVMVSSVSAWEIAIKRALGKLEAPDDLDVQLRRHRFTELTIHVRHARTYATLPDPHRDPFDRMLVAQAITDKLVLVTRDPKIRAYAVKTPPA